MLYSEKEVFLKNNMSAVFRSPTKEDSLQMLAYLKTVSEETNFLKREPEETDIPLTKEEEFLHAIAQSKDALMVACEIDGKIIGNCSLNRYSFARTQHRASIAIAIQKAYWGLGIGKYMLSELFRIAESMGIRQLELEVIESNERAIRLYEKFGFVKIGERPSAFCLKNGTKHGELMMIKLL